MRFSSPVLWVAAWRPWIDDRRGEAPRPPNPGLQLLDPTARAELAEGRHDPGAGLGLGREPRLLALDVPTNSSWSQARPVNPPSARTTLPFATAAAAIDSEGIREGVAVDETVGLRR